MRRRRAAAATSAAFFAAVLVWAPGAGADERVDLELVLAVDVSGSMDPEEAQRQRDGYLSALVHPRVVGSIQAGYNSAIAVTYIEWAAFGHNVVVADWGAIRDADSARAYADRLAEFDRRLFGAFGLKLAYHHHLMMVVETFDEVCRVFDRARCGLLVDTGHAYAGGFDYAKLFDLKDINSEFAETDVAVVVGACDVVNPAAATTEGTPISGMEILKVHEARQVIVCNLDDQPGYSGVSNALYVRPNAILLFDDAKATLTRVLEDLG